VAPAESISGAALLLLPSAPVVLGVDGGTTPPFAALTWAGLGEVGSDAFLLSLRVASFSILDGEWVDGELGRRPPSLLFMRERAGDAVAEATFESPGEVGDARPFSNQSAMSERPPSPPPCVAIAVSSVVAASSESPCNAAVGVGGSKDASAAGFSGQLALAFASGFCGRIVFGAEAPTRSPISWPSFSGVICLGCGGCLRLFLPKRIVAPLRFDCPPCAKRVFQSFPESMVPKPSEEDGLGGIGADPCCHGPTSVEVKRSQKACTERGLRGGGGLGPPTRLPPGSPASEGVSRTIDSGDIHTARLPSLEGSLVDPPEATVPSQPGDGEGLKCCEATMSSSSM